MPRLLHTWFRFLRVPNLFTAPGDALGGLFFTALLAQAVPAPATVALITAASFLAYAFGIITNDLCDLREDRRKRPERPLPRGDISLAAALAAAVFTAALSVLCAALAAPAARHASFLLLAAILLYNGGGKRLPVTGSILMGACRGCNVLLGAACLYQDAASAARYALFPAMAVTVIIAAVTYLADREDQTQIPGRIVFLPALAALLGWSLAAPAFPYPHVLANGSFCCSFLALALAVGKYALTGLSLYRHDVPPAVMQPAIGIFIRTLIPWQLAWILLHGSLLAWLTAAILFLAGYAARLLARHFPQS